MEKSVKRNNEHGRKQKIETRPRNGHRKILPPNKIIKEVKEEK